MTEKVYQAEKIVEVEAYLGAQDKASHGYNNRRTKRNENLYKEGGNAYVYFCYGMYYLFNVVTGKENTANAVLIRAIEPEIGIDIMMQRKMRRLKSKGDLSISKRLKTNSIINKIASESEKNLYGEIKGVNNIITNRITSGPGLLTIALGIDLRHNGIAIFDNEEAKIDVNSYDNFNKLNINDKNISNNDDKHNNKLEIWLEDRSLNISNKDIIETARIGVDYAEEHAFLPWRFKIKGNSWVSR